MKSKRLSTYLIIVSITTILCLGVWIGADVYRALITDKVRDSLSIQVEKLPPAIQWEVIDNLAVRDYEEVKFASLSATPE